jgi:hypothetical protein
MVNQIAVRERDEYDARGAENIFANCDSIMRNHFNKLCFPFYDSQSYGISQFRLFKSFASGRCVRQSYEAGLQDLRFHRDDKRGIQISSTSTELSKTRDGRTS